MTQEPEYDTNNPFALLPKPDRVKGGYRQWDLGPHAVSTDGQPISEGVLHISPPRGGVKMPSPGVLGDSTDIISWKLTGKVAGQKITRKGVCTWDTSHCAIFRDMIYKTWPTTPDGLMPPPRYRKSA